MTNVELPGMPARPATPEPHVLVIVTAVTVEVQGLSDTAAVATIHDELAEDMANFTKAWSGEGKSLRVLGTGAEVVARYGAPGEYERARERAWRRHLTDLGEP